MFKAKKMKTCLFTILFALTMALSFGQSSYEDVVYLKNGGIIRGLIIEQIPNKSIKIQTSDNNVFVYQINEVEKLAREEKAAIGASVASDISPSAGYKGAMEFGYQLKVGEYGLDRIKLNIVNGYQFNPYLTLGFGTGVRYYPDVEAALIPVFFDLRTCFVNKKISPYISVGAGYSFDATNNFQGVGLMLSPNLGVDIKISEKSSLCFGAGYELQKMKFFQFYYDYYNNYYYQGFFANSDAISINIGFSF
jgi:hypothetical protein